MRQSSLANRSSFAVGSANSAATLARLLEKKKEYDAVAALERASVQYLERITQIADDCDIMANAGECHGQVLGQWKKMFEILELFLASRDPDSQDTEQIGDMLVRVPIDEVEATNEQPTSQE
ncbi:hypothetical protein K435DRAFT_710967 [Dendrothele bispora CBS 962.96]|uniref:DASH complex subunit DAD2 n=1 Tax=Dendrothele bispora (strain CBS 962.96) TaxID=1314807 RepID=A0A4S8MU61_DENBC|nr:hypothetical protein K435DRAFT_710967 [Dendrothele bispora CBS 962.96]